ncbi:hypothetical protein [Parablautia muri]|uniref:hypothetical protein n=1 Tax=Parablautia muri TaxID=2320879 RepID=UPI001367BC36|nr:hypothetical protein [Parablautia muri]
MRNKKFFTAMVVCVMVMGLAVCLALWYLQTLRCCCPYIVSEEQLSSGKAL